MCEVCECMVGSRRKVCMKDECKESKYIYMNPDGRMRRGVCVYVEGGEGDESVGVENRFANGS